MKVTGYKLREALRRWQLRRDTASGQFDKSLKAFPGEDKPPPEDIAAAVLEAERVIATLQTDQTRYNVAVFVEVAGLGTMPLLECVKRVGGLARVEKMWRGVAGGEKKSKHSTFYEVVQSRKADEVTQKPTITPDEARKKAEVIGKRLAALREAIATANATELELEDLDPVLFE